MKELIKKLLTITIVTVAFFSVIGHRVSAQTTDDVCRGVAVAGANCDENANTVTVNNVIGVVINVLSTIVGIVAVVFIIIGGFKYITSSGDSSNVASAKNTILYAIVGLIIVALAQFITGFVLSRAT